MNLAYFESPIVRLRSSILDNGKSLVKRAIIAIEGNHTCNQGRQHCFTPDRIREIADNTNAEILNGRSIGLFENHHKSHQSKFGKLTGLLECRPVTEDDLPTPEARGMLGKVAIFANATIVKRIQEVKDRTIEALSPGIDTARNIIFEVSAVPVGAMPGVAFFSYQQVKERRMEYRDKRDKAIECLDTLVESFRQADREEEVPVNNISEQQQWFADFVRDLRVIFDLPEEESQGESEGEVTYSENPYDRDVVKGFDRENRSDDAEFEATKLSEKEKNAVVREASQVLKDTNLRQRASQEVNRRIRVRSG